MLKSALLAAVFSAGLAGTAAAAPITITFTSDGSFSNIQNCDAAPRSAKCAITQNNNLLDMSGNSNSTLKAIDTTTTPASFTLTSPGQTQNAVTLGQLMWTNNVSTNADQLFSVNYKLLLTFTSPANDIASQIFNLTVTQTNNNSNPADQVLGLVVTTLASDFQLPGVTVSNFKFTETSPYSSFNAVTGLWTLDEGHTATLTLSADFKAVQAVPEPVSMALLGTGLLGLGLVRRRRA